MPAHWLWCKNCRGRNYQVLKVCDGSVKVKCAGCGKVKYARGRYAWRLAIKQGMLKE